MRVCACGCGADLSASRSDAVYASDSCRKRVKRAASTDKARTRRASRDGKGGRVYASESELQLVGLALHMAGYGQEPITEKVYGALGRLRKQRRTR